MPAGQKGPHSQLGAKIWGSIACFVGGDRREEIFKDAQERARFLATLGETCAKPGWQVQALCLMGDHFHLVLETP